MGLSSAIQSAMPRRSLSAAGVIMTLIGPFERREHELSSQDDRRLLLPVSLGRPLTRRPLAVSRHPTRPDASHVPVPVERPPEELRSWSCNGRASPDRRLSLRAFDRDRHYWAY